jgi:hypothetical protein
MVDCGGFLSCTLKPPGCGSGTYTGNLRLTPVSFGIEVRQNVEEGYHEYLCI